MPGVKRFRFTLRSKLLVASLTLFIIPWIGFNYIQDMEAYLRSNQEKALSERAAMVAAIMQGQLEFFPRNTNTSQLNSNNNHLYVRSLTTPIQLDGYDIDWENYQQRTQFFDDRDLLYHGDSYRPGSLQLQQRVGIYKNYLYALFRVIDDKVIYRSPYSLRLDKSDYLEIAMLDRKGQFRRYQVATTSPGWVNAHELQKDNPIPLRTEPRIKGEWQDNADGYTIELRIPVTMIGSHLSFTVADVDDKETRETVAIIGQNNTDSAEHLGTVMLPSASVENLLNRINQPSSRIWVIDNAYRVIGVADNLQTTNQPDLRKSRSLLEGILHLFYQAVLRQPAEEFKDDLATASNLHGSAYQAALHGDATLFWRHTPDRQVNIVTAIQPIFANNKIVGAVAVEETSNSILILQNEAMEILINLSLLVFLVAMSVLVFFSSRISLRIRGLRDATHHAIAEDGRVQGPLVPATASDEIGDLSRSFADMLQRLSQYNQYLETIASKLTHELRTPITVIQSSLDNLESETLPEQTLMYTQRAREGIARLSTILTRMSEATRLEQTLQAEKLHDFDLHDLLSRCIDGYRLAHPQQKFVFNPLSVPLPVTIHGSADLIAQLLDKLVANACDFTAAEQPISITLTVEHKTASIEVINYGSQLPDSMSNNLFDSMVSLRSHSSTEPHLGLGLYIVRLITEFHRGQVTACNLPAKDGVKFSVHLPLATA